MFKSELPAQRATEENHEINDKLYMFELIESVEVKRLKVLKK